MLETLIDAYGFSKGDIEVQPFGSGLINSTWVISSGSEKYILQKINHHIFKNPPDIAHNLKAIKEYLSKNFEDYLFAGPITTSNNQEMHFEEGEGYFRLFPFIKGSHTIDVVETPDQAFEAAKQFGQFTRVLSGFDASTLKNTLPHFHNLSLRYAQFSEALKEGNPLRIAESATIINFIKENTGIVTDYEKIKNNKNFKQRVTHHDTKISNVLLDEENKGLCVIDLDTVMPGFFISDVGDMMRTYLCPVSEEENNYDLIEVRGDFFKAIAQGYLDEMKGQLSDEEKQFFVFSGKFMIYMQAMRFITDYLNNDIYYGSKYPGQNLVRANNQYTLFMRLLEKEPVFTELIRKL